MRKLVEYLSRDEEKRKLIRRIFPSPFSGSDQSGLILFKICKELGSSYCSQFDDRGYTKEYVSFDQNRVYDGAARLLTDDLLQKYSKEYASELSSSHDFNGKFFNFDSKLKVLSVGSKWDEIRRYIESLIAGYEECVKCVLSAIAEVSRADIFDSYWAIMVLAKEKGLGKGWWKIITKLQLGGIIGKDNRHLNLQEELIPLVEEILKGGKD